MELWELIAQLCKAVVDNQNVYLDILFTQNGVELQLMPLEGGWEWEDDDGDLN